MQLLDGIQERVDGHIGHALHLVLELLAERAQRVGEHRDLAAAVATHRLDGEIERQACEIDGVEIVPARLGEVFMRLRIDDATEHEMLAALIRVQDFLIGDDFIQAGKLGAIDLRDVDLGHALVQRRTDRVRDFRRHRIRRCEGRLRGERCCRQQRECSVDHACLILVSDARSERRVASAKQGAAADRACRHRRRCPRNQRRPTRTSRRCRPRHRSSACRWSPR